MGRVVVISGQAGMGDFDYSTMPDPKLFLDMSQSHETNVDYALRFLQDL